MEDSVKRSKRPRITRTRDSFTGSGSEMGTSERRPQGERKTSGDRPFGERKSFGNKPYGARKQYSGEHNSFGGRKSYGQNRPFQGTGNGSNSSEQKPFEGKRPYGSKPRGERKSFNDRPYDERKPYGESRFSGERRPYGERKSSGERKPFNDRPYGDRKPYGEKKYFSSDRRSFADRKPYGKPYGPRKEYVDDAAAAGINRMIDIRDKAAEERYSDNDNVCVPIKDVVRLNKFISNSGICSRREADNYILAGVVTVNGEVVTELGTKINVNEDDVRFNGERLRGEEKIYIIMNKPKGYVTTAGDPHADKTVMDLLTGCTSRVFPVGRLDKNTTGVLMFTNDGEIAEKLTHPSYDKKKIYQVNLDSDLKKDDFDKILSGLILTDGEIAADDLQYIDEQDHRKVGIEIHSGKNRIVRRMFESLGYEVKALDRVYFAGLTKKGIKRGGWRYLTEGEVNVLKIGAYK